MLVALERFDLRIPGCRSLKQKRHVLTSLTAALRQRFPVSVAEVEHQELWQRSQISVVTVGSDDSSVRQTLEHALLDAERCTPECIIQGTIEII